MVDVYLYVFIVLVHVPVQVQMGDKSYLQNNFEIWGVGG
jgi:hypothetical protein